MKNQKELCIIDRFEGDLAVIGYNGTHFDFPRSLFLGDPSEGDVLIFNVAVDKKETQKRWDEINALTKNMFRDE
jgi:Protein of unknown function (DUF3006)